MSTLNQMTETHRVRDLARMIAEVSGAKFDRVLNPRREADENDLFVTNDRFFGLGLDPINLGWRPVGGDHDDRVEVCRSLQLGAHSPRIRLER